MAYEDSWPLVPRCFPWIFFLAVFALSAPLWLLGSRYSFQLMPGLPISALMVIAPAIVASGFTWRVRGFTEVRRLFRRTVDWGRIPSLWWIPILLLMPGVLFGSYLVMRVLGMRLPNPQIPWLEAPMLFGLFLCAAAAEELAWTGTVLEPLQAQWGTMWSALLIGVAWALWHVIPFAQAGNSVPWIAGQCGFTVAFRVVIVWLYNHAGRSLVAAIATHASYNLAWQLFPNRGSGYHPWVAGSITALVAILLVSCGEKSFNAAGIPPAR